ncbi:MAG: flagellar biosynthetic protein FliR [Candidatus Korobacteraceae bacterium]|jgi:flagellar biosynthetic protein FliR
MNPPLTLESALAAAVFIGLRLSGLLLFAPGLSNNAVPARTKIAFVVAGVVLLWPIVPTPQLHLTRLSFAGIALNELLIGVIVGLLLNFIFDAAQFAGQVLGMQMGFSLATMIDPQSQADSAVLSVFYQTIVLLIFFALDVHHWILRALVSSFYYLPAGRSVLTFGRVEAVLHTASAIWVLGLQIAAPALIATVIADFVLAFIGKASPQLPVLFVGLSVKSVLGMLVTIAVMAAWPRFFSLQFANAVRWSEQTLHLMN